MIPGKIIRFLEERANAGFAGTRDRDLVPSGHRVTGWRIAADACTLTAYVPEVSAARLVDALQDNGQIAITVEEVGTHETYQLKGRYLGHRPVRPDEVEVSGRARERFVKGIASLYPYPGIADKLRDSIPMPVLAVDVEVHEVFLQTPGPGAGARIAPPPDMVIPR